MNITRTAPPPPPPQYGIPGYFWRVLDRRVGERDWMYPVSRYCTVKLNLIGANKKERAGRDEALKELEIQNPVFLAVNESESRFLRKVYFGVFSAPESGTAGRFSAFVL